ncbi:MAG: hypothetical protein RLZZ297_1489 [Chloroflexota bacterium]
MSDFAAIYASQSHAAAYHTLVMREDYQGNLATHIAGLADLPAARVLDMGCGTGRVAGLLGPCRSLTASDRAGAMLHVARQHLPTTGRLVQADNTALPFAAGSFDVVTAGWSFGHATEWLPGSWQANVRRAITEMRRVLAPGGVAIIAETLGSGVATPAPPTPVLAECYALFEQEFGMTRTAVATDYRFASADEATQLTSFFFGVAMGSETQADGTVIVPEWTGVWHSRV